MTEPTMIQFPKEDGDYLRWKAEHPTGFVINVHKNHAVDMVWHRADCWHLEEDGEEKVKWVEGDYFKVCSLNAGALAEWVSTQPKPLHYCLTCRDAWLKEQQPQK